VPAGIGGKGIRSSGRRRIRKKKEGGEGKEEEGAKYKGEKRERGVEKG
jgi:hypothetical protein